MTTEVPGSKRVVFNEVRCKTVLHEMDGRGSYTANLYRGCSHGCVYCYAPSLIHDERGWGSYVDVKVNAPGVLARELRGYRRGTVFLSSASDPYQPAEARYRLTRRSLEILLRAGFPVVLLTRSPLVLRDLDLLKRFPWVRVGLSISSVRERRFEPGVAPLKRRMETLRALSSAGVRTWVSMAPLVPGVTAISLSETLAELKAAGVSMVSAGALRFQGYGRSRELFERVSGLQATQLLQGAEEMVAEARELIEKLGLRSGDDFFEWKEMEQVPMLDSYIPMSSSTASEVRPGIS